MNYKLLITTSGTGSRLGDLTKDTNKSLIKVGGKEIISHIIEIYPEDVEIVVTLGYKGDKVKKFLDEKYSNRNINYVYVDKYEGPGSSLGYSILNTKNILNSPFIFHCNDTIVNKYNIENINTNWAGGFKVRDSNQYTTFTVDGEKIKKYNVNKGEKGFDYAHIGVVGIYDYKIFFDILEKLYNSVPNNSSLNDVYVLEQMLQRGININAIEFKNWLDTGNLKSLELSKLQINDL